MRQICSVITHPSDQCNLALQIPGLQADERRVQTERHVGPKGQNFIGHQLDAWPKPVVLGIAKRHKGVQTIVAASQEDRDHIASTHTAAGNRRASCRRTSCTERTSNGSQLRCDQLACADRRRKRDESSAAECAVSGALHHAKKLIMVAAAQWCAWRVWH